MSSTGLKRNRTDKFYTKTSVVDKCILSIRESMALGGDEKCSIIEPSAGNGAFIEGIKELTQSYMFYDIEPQHSEIVEHDFLKLDLDSMCRETFDKHSYKVFVGNPPFGRQSSLAIQFIKKCAPVANFICFILPNSFKKESMKKHFPLNFSLIHQHDLDDNSFVINGEEHDVPCVFQIWKRGVENRVVPSKLEPSRFKFVKKEDGHDISFRRVGVNAGAIDKKTDDKSFQSHYFIKFDEDVDQETTITKLKGIIYETGNTVGPKSISKQELIKEFNNHM